MFNIKVNILFYINTIVEGFQPSWLPGPGSESVVTWDATFVIPDHAFVRNLVYLHVESRKLVRA
jgi:hypothetical protein